MPEEFVGVIALVLMLVLTMMRVPIFLSLAIPGILGVLYLRDWNVVVSALTTNIWDSSFQYTLSTLPMFILMGAMLHASGISTELFAAFRSWFGRVKGGLGISTVGASALFAAASGSSVANTGTIGMMASKEMMNAGYSKVLTSGSIISGGTLGILIPPSTFLIVYGTLTDQSIGQLLLAGILPGILLAVSFAVTIYLTVVINPKLAPATEGGSWHERLVALKSTGWILLMFMIVIGGMFFGLFGPTEAAGIGAFTAIILTVIKGKFTWKVLLNSVHSTALTTGYIFAIVLAAFLFKYLLIISKLPLMISSQLTEMNVPNWVLFLAIVLMYFALGAVMDTMGMIMVTIPVVIPIIQYMGLDLIWFGIVVCLLVELAMISPPQGVNCFILDSVSPELGLKNIWLGSLIFMIPIFFVIALLYVFPEIALFIPNRMLG
ncbi:TRAP transporter large permease [Halalkalibacter krulwichiae]|uniref:Sialic acid TRAP transporter permease protein SiaT n=1 Tax=Halalkalibacter krulwichiae TaxID=199441 RepID=A0A1X9MEB4_9BACI|nr:TRAP transporter large permease [Halalkalibacter krulwichiae]ARK29881.1 Sialic acid TRAP transporter permease protein SiaT [Halalkalibacter krulwichiae]